MDLKTSENNLKVVTVGRSDNIYPGNFTSNEIKIILQYATGHVINLFSGKSIIGDLRIDFACKEATNNWDVFDFLENSNLIDFDTVILDAPYNKIFADKYQKLGNTPKQFIIFANAKKTTRLFQLIRDKINPKIIIMKSWNYYIPFGYYLLKGFLCYTGGFRKSTLLLIFRKFRGF